MTIANPERYSRAKLFEKEGIAIDAAAKAGIAKAIEKKVKGFLNKPKGKD